MSEDNTTTPRINVIVNYIDGNEDSFECPMYYMSQVSDADIAQAFIARGLHKQEGWFVITDLDGYCVSIPTHQIKNILAVVYRYTEPVNPFEAINKLLGKKTDES